MDPATGSTDIGIAQPVSVDRLILVEMLPVVSSHEGSTRIRTDTGRLGNVEATCVDGRVHIRWDDKPEETTVEDLTRLVHEFIVGEDVD